MDLYGTAVLLGEDFCSIVVAAFLPNGAKKIFGVLEKALR